MALCGQGVDALSLPSEVIVHILSFLPMPDRLRASASCSHWRECLFHPRLWRQVRLRLCVSQAEHPQLDFIMRKCGSFVRELHVEFTQENYLSSRGDPGATGGGAGSQKLFGSSPAGWLDELRTYLELVLCVLSSIRNNRKLHKFSLFGDIIIMQHLRMLLKRYGLKVDPDGKKIKQIQQLSEEILGNSRQLKWLSCGFLFLIVTPTSLSSLSNPIANTMEHLSLLSIPGSNTTLITAVELERFVNLRSLALDFCDFTADMARVLADNHVHLRRLSLIVRPFSQKDKSLDNMPEDEHWKALTQHSTSLRVYIMAFNISGDYLLKILKPSIPLERIHFESFITGVSEAVVDLISRQYNKFLTHFIIRYDRLHATEFPDLSDGGRRVDPLVLLARSCKRLSILAVHGYIMWGHNLIAITRLQGSDLKVLEVTKKSIAFSPGELLDQNVDSLHNLTEQVSLGLGRPWHTAIDIKSLSVFTEPNLHFFREMQSFSEGI